MKWTIRVLLLLVMVVPFSLEAAVGYTVAPRLINESVEARDVIKRQVTITNNDRRPIRVFASVNEIDLTDGGDIKSFTSPAMSDRSKTITSWVEIRRGQTEILPGESATLPLTIRIPPQVDPGTYHALIGFGEGSNGPAAQKKVRSGEAPGIIVSIEHEAEEPEYLKLGGFGVDNYVSDPTRGELFYELENPSSVPVQPTGELIFYDSRGAEVAAIPVNPDGHTIPAGESERFTDMIPAGGLLGQYKAFLNVEYGETQTASLQDTAFFVAAPWYYLVGVIALLLLVAGGIIVYHYRTASVGEDDEADELPLFVRDTHDREEQEHDIRITANDR